MAGEYGGQSIIGEAVVSAKSVCDRCGSEADDTACYAFHAYKNASTKETRYSSGGPISTTMLETTYVGVVNGSAIICDSCVGRQRILQWIFIAACALTAAVTGYYWFVLWPSEEPIPHDEMQRLYWWTKLLVCVAATSLCGASAVVRLMFVSKTAAGNDLAAQVNKQRLRSQGYTEIDSGHLHSDSTKPCHPPDCNRR